MKFTSHFLMALVSVFVLTVSANVNAQSPTKENTGTAAGPDLGTSCVQWAGNCNTTDAISRTGSVGIGGTPSSGVGLVVGSFYGEAGGNLFSTGIYAQASETAVLAQSISASQPAIRAVNSNGYSAQFHGDVGVTGKFLFNNNNAQIGYQDNLTISPGSYKFKSNGEMEMTDLLVYDKITVNTVNAITLNANFIRATNNLFAKEITVKLPPFPDYVFEKSYTLMPLKKLEEFIEANKRLPNMPSAEEVEAYGGNIGELQVKQMEKIEELTLYILEMNKRLEKLEVENKVLKEHIEAISKN